MPSVSMLVLSADKHTVVTLMTVEARIASQVVGSYFPVHMRLVIDFEVPAFLDLLESV